VYENEIFAILGHNGAGKSTLIKIMTGALKPDNGEILYEGLTLRNNIQTIREKIGNFFFFRCCSKELSGGQKRKLCIGIALIGNPKYMFLDEPTTSLDPLSRRKIWDLLIKLKKNRIIFLCTHYMDEADILADRKMIINKGKIRCLGTSLFLKHHFNLNYQLNIETKDKKEV
ncbi:hypothetical protein PIROE2DRAFT_44521, partial [Piromyces sp. E2]